jgi:hypothetical protein
MQLGLEFSRDLSSAKISEKRWQLADDDKFESVELVSAVQFTVQLWSVNQRATDAVDSLPGNV